MNTQRTLDHVWRHLVPACDRPPSADEDTVVHALADRHMPGPGCPVRDPEAPPLADPVSLRVDATGPVLLWPEADHAETPLGTDGVWVRSRLRWGGRSIEVAGTAVDHGGQLEATVAVLSQPHLIDLRVRPGDTTTHAMWRTSPLGTHRLADLALEDPA